MPALVGGSAGMIGFYDFFLKEYAIRLISPSRKNPAQ